MPLTRPLETIAAASERTGISRPMLRKLWALRQLPGFKIGARVMLDPDELDEFIAARRVEALR